MEQKEQTPVERFYQDVAAVLNIDNAYEYNKFTVGGKYLTRWNNRKPGNGRFEGYGLIRYFGPHMIHASLTYPVSINRTFSSPELFLDWLKKTIDTNNQTP